MYKAILWDNDGILVETEQWYYKATKEVMEIEGFQLTIELYRETFLKSNIGAWHLLENTDQKYISRLRKKRNDLYASYLESKNIFTKDISPILKKLNNVYKMGIVTSSRKDHFDIIHKRNNILQYFDFVITPNDYANSKPNPEPYLLGIKHSGYKDIECIAIEDSERGVISAKQANLYCIAIPNQMTINSDFSKADIIVNNIDEIMNLLN